MRETVPLSDATQTAPSPYATAVGPRATSMVSVEGNAASSRLILVTVPSSLLATQIAFAPNAMAAGPCPTVIGGSDPSWNVAGLKRLTVWSSLLATHRR